jgi:hypothetical protein
VVRKEILWRAATQRFRDSGFVSGLGFSRVHIPLLRATIAMKIKKVIQRQSRSILALDMARP